MEGVANSLKHTNYFLTWLNREDVEMIFPLAASTEPEMRIHFFTKRGMNLCFSTQDGYEGSVPEYFQDRDQ